MINERKSAVILRHVLSTFLWFFMNEFFVSVYGFFFWYGYCWYHSSVLSVQLCFGQYLFFFFFSREPATYAILCMHNVGYKTCVFCLEWNMFVMVNKCVCMYHVPMRWYLPFSVESLVQKHIIQLISSTRVRITFIPVMQSRVCGATCVSVEKIYK